MTGYPPDWDYEYRCVGGHLEDIPKPHVYFWPNQLGIKREIKVRLMRFEFGNKHIHVSLRQEPNPVWDGSYSDSLKGPRGWTVPWSGPGEVFPGEGLVESDVWSDIELDKGRDQPWIFTYRIDAMRAIEKLRDKCFPDHDIEWEDFTGDDPGMIYVGKHGE